VAGCGAPAREQPRRDTPVQKAGCDVGAERPSRLGGQPALVLACERTPAGTEIRLSSLRDDAGPCLTIDGLPGGTRACGRAPSELGPPSRAATGAGAIVRRAGGAPLELYGATAPAVRRVLLRYRLSGGRAGRRPATLMRVTDPGALRAAGIREPFGSFVGAVPRRAREVMAAAVDRSGEVLGRAAFDGFGDMVTTVFIARPD
jgi:hypothetical protein